MALTEGRAEVRVRCGAGSCSLTVDTGSGPRVRAGLSGPDAAECAAALLGRALATDAVVPAGFACPADALVDVDAVVTTVAAQGHPVLALVVGGSPRRRAAEQVVRAAGAQRGVDIRPPGATPARTYPLVVVSGWTTAAATLRARPHATVRAAP